MGIIAFNNEPKYPFTYLLNKEKNNGFATEVKHMPIKFSKVSEQCVNFEKAPLKLQRAIKELQRGEATCGENHEGQSEFQDLGLSAD